jgi:hypothetical protein
MESCQDVLLPYLKDMLSRRELSEASGNRIFLFGFSSDIATNIDGYGFCTGIGMRKKGLMILSAVAWELYSERWR